MYYNYIITMLVRRLSTLNFELSSHLRTLRLLLNTHNVIVCLFLHYIVSSILFQGIYDELFDNN